MPLGLHINPRPTPGIAAASEVAAAGARVRLRGCAWRGCASTPHRSRPAAHRRTRAVLDAQRTYERRRLEGHLAERLQEPGRRSTSTRTGAAWISSRRPYHHRWWWKACRRRVVVKIGDVQAAMFPPTGAGQAETSAAAFAQWATSSASLLFDGASSKRRAVLWSMIAPHSNRTPARRLSMVAVDNASGEVIAMVSGRDMHICAVQPRRRSARRGRLLLQAYDYTAAVDRRQTRRHHRRRPHQLPHANGYATAEGDHKGMTLLNAFAESPVSPRSKSRRPRRHLAIIEVTRTASASATHPRCLPIAIGAADISLYERVQSYSVFPNDDIPHQPPTSARWRRAGRPPAAR